MRRVSWSIFLAARSAAATTVAAPSRGAPRCGARPVESSRMRVRVRRWAAWACWRWPQRRRRRSRRAGAAPAIRARSAAATGAAAARRASAPVSLSARKVYEQARSQLVQIRTVLKGRASQTSVGSGFFVTDAGPHHHQLPRRQRSGAEARAPRPGLRHRRRPRGAAADPAARRAARPGAAARRRRRRAQTFDALPFRPADEPLSQGERIYSLGNPLDVGFAVDAGHLQRPGASAASIRRSSSAARSRPA